MIDYKFVESQVDKILGKDSSGHSTEHVLTVVNNAKQILDNLTEECNADIVLLSCYLHDVDDYKLVGEEQAETLANTRNILSMLDISQDDKSKVIQIIENMGYSKLLKGIRPTTIEGMVVSDADMLDGGANGVIRCLEFGFSKSRKVFDVNIMPVLEMDAATYRTIESPSINHFFEKLLLIKDVMMTSHGKKMAQKRHDIMIQFLENFFEERHEDCSQWLELLNKYK